MSALKPLRRHMKRFTKRRFLEKEMAKRFGAHSREFYLIKSAIAYISEAHKGENRRKNQASRLSHEREMIGIADYHEINDWVIYVAILLHDIVEDYRHKGWTFVRIDAEFGVEVGKLVRALHKSRRRKNEPRRLVSDRTFNRVARGGKKAVIVKYIDRLHNLLHPWPGGEKRIRIKMHQTITHLLPLAVRYRVNTHLLLLAIIRLHRKYGLDKPIAPKADS